MKYWPNQVLSFLLSITEVNINLSLTYLSGQEPTGQINFHKKLAKTLTFNMHYNEDDDKTPDKSENNKNMAIVSSCYPRAKNFLVHESSQQTVNIRSTNAIHAKRVRTYCLCSPGVYWCAECFSYHLAKRVRTYCLCSPGVYWCAECFGYHLACTKNNLSTPD